MSYKVNHKENQEEKYRREISLRYDFIKEASSERKNNFDDLPPCVIPFELDSDFAWWGPVNE